MKNTAIAVVMMTSLIMNMLFGLIWFQDGQYEHKHNDAIRINVAYMIERQVMTSDGKISFIRSDKDWQVKETIWTFSGEISFLPVGTRFMFQNNGNRTRILIL